jgi:hypothetical protein
MGHGGDPPGAAVPALSRMFWRRRSPAPLVRFLIAGVQKGGTTSLYEYLRQHPELALSSRKEVHFFDDEAQFASGRPKPGRICGEATPIYSYWRPAMRRIRDYNPKMKLVLLLRNPIERAWSHWRMETARSAETLPFGRAIREEAGRLRETLPLQHRVYSYVDRGYYSTQIRRVRELFPERNLLFVKSDSLFADPAAVTMAVQRFLGVSARAPDVSAIHNPGADDRVMPVEDRRFLADLFRDEIRATERLLGWDCGDWLETR